MIRLACRAAAVLTPRSLSRTVALAPRSLACYNRANRRNMASTPAAAATAGDGGTGDGAGSSTAASSVLGGAAPSLSELRGMSCKGKCSKDTPRMAEADLPRYLALLPAWELSDDKTLISRSFTARNFMAAMNFLNALGALAEEETHHPDLHLTGYRNVTIELSTHAIGGLAVPDFIMASKIDTIPVDYSPKWLEKQQAAGKEVPGASAPSKPAA